MPFAWRLFLDLAEELGARADEAAWRTAIGRAYYAAAGVAYDGLPTAERATITPGNYHERMWSIYALSSAPACRRIGNGGYRLRGRRRISDYRADIEVVAHDARLALTDARRIIQLIDQHGYWP